MKRRSRKGNNRGSALLAVLWLSAFLAVIALSLGAAVRGDLDRASAASNGLRAHYLAAGSIDRTLLHLQWQATQTVPATMHFSYPTGVVDVRLIPEKDKQDVNTISQEAMLHLLTTLEVPESARALIAARFAPVRPPIHDLEELLSFDRVTPDLYFGQASYTDGKPAWRKGLRDYLTATSSEGVFTLISTAQVNSIHRSVAALVRLKPIGRDPSFRILRWYDDASSLQISSMQTGSAIP